MPSMMTVYTNVYFFNLLIHPISTFPVYWQLNIIWRIQGQMSQTFFSRAFTRSYASLRSFTTCITSKTNYSPEQYHKCIIEPQISNTYFGINTWLHFRTRSFFDMNWSNCITHPTGWYLADENNVKYSLIKINKLIMIWIWK